MNLQKNGQFKQGTYVSTSISLPERIGQSSRLRDQEEMQMDVRSQENYSLKFPEFQQQNFSDQFFNKQSPDYFLNLIEQPSKNKQPPSFNNNLNQPNSQNREPDFSKILKQSKFHQKTSNSIRFLVNVALQHIAKYYREQYTGQQWQNISQFCQNVKKWHLENKNNVYKFDHLIELFKSAGLENQGKIRNIFNAVLRKYSLSAMKNPKCQIQNKELYLRVTKLFSLRCRNYTLCLRNQSR